MRLIETTELKLKEFFPGQIPPYAILSHTWGPDEVDLQEFRQGKGTSKRGYRKILRAANLARPKYKYIWVDTCCIDKTHHAELAESLNSMYQWYQEAEVCYAFLEDLKGTDDNTKITKCRWFTRGWTLQELVAPRVLRFYDADMVCRGHKHDFTDAICARTHLPWRILSGVSTPAEYSMARRMSWAAGRETTRVEDMAYCLLGILGVNMPPIYGEGTRAFRRLQEEIVKYNSDMTVLAWSAQPSANAPLRVGRSLSPSPLPSPAAPGGAGSNASGAATVTTKPPSVCLFAPSPSSFAGCANLSPFKDDFENFSVTNRGLFVSGTSSLRMSLARPTGSSESLRQRYVLLVGSQGSNYVGIYLVKMGPDLFQRDWDMDLAVLEHKLVNAMRAILVTDWYILIEPRGVSAAKPATFRRSAIHVPVDGGHNQYTILKDAAPTNLWDAQDRVFLRPKAYQWIRYSMVLSLTCMVFLDNDEGGGSGSSQGEGRGSGKTHENKDEARSTRYRQPVMVVVLCRYQSQNTDPTCVVFLADDYPREVDMLFTQRAPNSSLLWTDLAVQCPYLATLPSHVDVKASTGESAATVTRTTGSASIGGKGWSRISVSFKKGPVELSTSIVDLYSVHFKIERLAPRRRDDDE